MSKVKVATPVSTIFRDPTQLDEILSLSQVLEIRDDSVDVNSDLPRIFHCEASLVEPWSDDELGRIANIVKNETASLVSFHLKSCFVDAPVRDGMFVPEGKQMSQNDMLQNAAQNLQKFHGLVGNHIRVAVENNNYLPTPAYEIVTDPEFISKLINNLGILLLLDISHVQVSSGNKKMPAEEYLKGFDLSKVIQVHLSKPELISGIWRDKHEALQKDDWIWSQGVMKRCPNLQYATIEYYQDEEKLISMLKTLGGLIR